MPGPAAPPSAPAAVLPVLPWACRPVAARRVALAPGPSVPRTWPSCPHPAPDRGPAPLPDRPAGPGRRPAVLVPACCVLSRRPWACVRRPTRRASGPSSRRRARAVPLRHRAVSLRPPSAGPAATAAHCPVLPAWDQTAGQRRARTGLPAARWAVSPRAVVRPRPAPVRPCPRSAPGRARAAVSPRRCAGPRAPSCRAGPASGCPRRVAARRAPRARSRPGCSPGVVAQFFCSAAAPASLGVFRSSG